MTLRNSEALPSSETPTKLRLMIVDDDPSTGPMYKDLFELAHDYEVTLYKNAEEALEALNNSSSLPNVALVDFYLPGMNGAKLAQKILSLGNIHIVVCSGRDISGLPKNDYVTQIPKGEIDKLQAHITALAQTLSLTH